MVLRGQESTFRVVPPEARHSFDGDGADFRLGTEAQRIAMAAQFAPMLAVVTSDLDPLPHQIQTVYGDLLARDRPLRFLRADDPPPVGHIHAVRPAGRAARRPTAARHAV